MGIGGVKNTVTSNFGVVLGGFLNTADGRFASVLGGAKNTARGRYSIAAGYLAKAFEPNTGAFRFTSTPLTVCKEVGLSSSVSFCANKILLYDGTKEYDFAT